MAIRIVTDSSVNLPSDLVQRMRIVLVPALIIFGEQALEEGVEITTSKVIERLNSGAEFPKTSQPPPSAFESAYRSILEEDPATTILSLHLTGAQSGTVRSAEKGAKAVLGGYPRAAIHVIDTQAFSIAQALIVREVARMVDLGSALEPILDRVKDMREKVQLFFVLDTLDFVHRGGRLGRAAHLVGSLLRIKAILTFRNGELVPYARVRTMKKALAMLADLVAQGAEGLQHLHIAVGYAIRKVEARRLAKVIKGRLQPEHLSIQEIGPALAVYTGPGAVGIAWYAPELISSLK